MQDNKDRTEIAHDEIAELKKALDLKADDLRVDQAINQIYEIIRNLNLKDAPALPSLPVSSVSDEQINALQKQIDDLKQIMNTRFEKLRMDEFE